MKDLGTLRGGNSYAVGINAGGQIVGCSGAGDDDCHAFLYSGGTMKDLGTLGGRASFAQAINAAGQVVGASRNARGANHAFLYSGGTMKDLGELGGVESYARGITSTGLVTGYAATRGGNARRAATRAFLYRIGTGFKDLGTLGGATSCAWGINDNGEVVGCSDVDGAIHPFLYSSGAGMKDLGTLGGRDAFAAAVNSLGQVVGWAATADGESHAFLYAAGAMTRLELGDRAGPGLDSHQRHGRQRGGQIVGYGTAQWQSAGIWLRPDRPLWNGPGERAGVSPDSACKGGYSHQVASQARSVCRAQRTRNIPI